jgi:hypothetical protein
MAMTSNVTRKAEPCSWRSVLYTGTSQKNHIHRPGFDWHGLLIDKETWGC